MSLLTLEEMVERNVLKEETVEAFGGEVRVREMSAEEKDEWESWIALSADDGNLTKRSFANKRARLLQSVMIGEDGRRLCTAQHIPILGRLSATELDKVFVVAARLSGLGPEDAEDEAGNSEDAPGDNSSSEPD